MSINISDYNRSDVFIEERDQSVIETPVAQQGTINFVPGFSRTSTVFNRPLLVRSSGDRERFFGKIDRFLEKKGSFFHRTLDVATQTAPVWALNLLKTNSQDELNYISLSTAAQYNNDIIRKRQYDDFFNKSGFWQRDTESFLFFAQDNDRIMHLTNLGDKKVSIFAFKSNKPGFNKTAEDWYGGIDNVPTWMNPKDLISDYMIRVIILRGDWSNYTQLAIDPNYTQFFNSSGLIKNQVNNFINKREVTVLADYEGSLIPYFRDQNRNLLFIETLINNDTDRTGVFCSYDLEAVETDFPTGNVDIIGHTLVGTGKTDINFLSYQEHIEETDNYPQTELDRLGNVKGINFIQGDNLTKTSVFSNENMSGLVINEQGSFATDSEPEMELVSTNGYVIINDTQIEVNTQSIQLSELTTPGTESNYNITVIYLNENGTLNFIEGPETNFASGTPITGISNLVYPANYPANAVVLGYVFREKDENGDYNNIYETISLNSFGFNPMTMSPFVTNTGQILVDDSLNNNILDLEFLGTGSVTQADYAAYRAYKFFDELVSRVSFGRSVIIGTTGTNDEYIKVELNSSNWVDNSNTPTGNRRITITVDSTIDIQTQAANDNALVLYYIDDEFIVDIGSSLDGFETRQTETSSSTLNLGIVAKHSKFYLDFYNGIINTKDYFYQKRGDATIEFLNFNNVSFPSLIGDYVVFETADLPILNINTGTHILTDDHSVNQSNYVLGTAIDGTTQDGIDLGIATTQTAFLVTNSVATTGPELTTIYDFNLKTYMKMYTINDKLEVRFRADNTLDTPTSIAVGLLSNNINLKIYSNIQSFEQTLEIEQHPNYEMTDTTFLIDAVRYSDVIVGNYVKAYVDTNELQPGEYFNRFARIIRRRPWSENATFGVNYAEITVNKKVFIREFGQGDLQTQRYVNIQEYINTLKTIKLEGFTVRPDSIPDGTEERQKEILDILDKNGSIFKAIVNKNRFNFRYLIDSFGLGLTEFSKQQLVDITGKRKNAMSFINMPSAKSFRQSSSPSFINPDGTLNMEFVKEGGNLNQNPPFLYSFADGFGKDDGRSTAGYFFPYLTVNDNGRPLQHPPAPFVANTYTRKLNSPVAGIYNWTVAAGVEDGLIRGVSGVEMDFSEEDLEQLYAMGANPIVFTRNVGYNIETEWTAQRQPISALSYLHVREILIDLENELYAMLIKYRWKFNTPGIRAKIKREADATCQSYVDRSALFAFENKIDEENNTPQLIDNQFGLLETWVEPVKAMGIIVNIINVMGTGDIGTSTGFTPQD